MNSEQKTVWSRFPVVLATAFFCCLLWGSANPSIKTGYRIFRIEAGDMPSRLLFAGVRFTIAGLMVIAYESITRKKFVTPRGGEWKYVLALASTQTVLQYIFYYMGLAHTTGVRTAVINASGTFFSIFMAAFLFHFEKLNLKKIVGALIGFAGVVLMVTGGSLSGLAGKFSLPGEGAVLVAALMSALAGCLIKLFSGNADPVMMSGWQFFLGGLVMVLIGILAGGHLVITTLWCIVLIAYMGFISAGAYTLWGILLKYNPVSTITVLGFMNPVMGVLLSALFLDEGNEAFTLVTLVALILISIGIVIVNTKSSGGGKRSLA